MSDPANPRIVDSVQANTRLINDLMTDEAGKVMVFTREGASDRKNGIVIATLDDPLHPKVVAEYTEGVTAGVHSAFIYTQPKYGTHVYLTNDGTGALHIVDINDPAHPKLAATWKTPRADAGRYLHDVAVAGRAALRQLLARRAGDPRRRQGHQGRQSLQSAARRAVQVRSRLALPPGRARTAAPATCAARIRPGGTAGTCSWATRCSASTRSGSSSPAKPSRAYGRLHVLDVSDIANPREVAWYEPEYGGVHNVWVAGDTLYMGAYNAGFRAFDISGELRGDLRAQGREITDLEPSDPDGFVANAPMTWGAVVKNGLAYVNDFNSGLYLVRMEPERKPGAALVP